MDPTRTQNALIDADIDGSISRLLTRLGLPVEQFSETVAWIADATIDTRARQLAAGGGPQAVERATLEAAVISGVHYLALHDEMRTAARWAASLPTGA